MNGGFQLWFKWAYGAPPEMFSAMFSPFNIHYKMLRKSI